MAFRLGPLEILILFIILIPIGIIFAVVKLAKRRVPSSKDRPAEAAKERYAKGEINKAEFDQIKKDISP